MRNVKALPIDFAVWSWKFLFHVLNEELHVLFGLIRLLWRNFPFALRSSDNIICRGSTWLILGFIFEFFLVGFRLWIYGFLFFWLRWAADFGNSSHLFIYCYDYNSDIYIFLLEKTHNFLSTRTYRPHLPINPHRHSQHVYIYICDV